jgi:hypothetical protein
MAGTGGAAGGGATGGSAGSATDAGGDAMDNCTTCLMTQCGKEASDCEANADCKKAFDCFNDCTQVKKKDPVTCATVTCASTNAKFTALLGCAMGKCQADCQ